MARLPKVPPKSAYTNYNSKWTQKEMRKKNEYHFPEAKTPDMVGHAGRVYSPDESG